MTIPENARYLLNGLNPSQAEAASAMDGPLLILAGAGAGKTHTITRRAALLIATERCRPEQLLMVTFTNKAAREMRERLAALLGVQTAKRIWALTFHALCAQVLRRDPPQGYTQSFTILDSSEARRALAKLAKAHGLNDADAREKISKAKGSGQGREGLPYELRPLYDAYTVALREQNALDFDDLLLHGLAAMQADGSPWRDRFAYVMVDETQDTGSGQALMLHALAGTHKNLCVIGDDGQCQPGSTLVRTIAGDVRMDELDPGTHRLVSYDRRQSRFSGAVQGHEFTISQRPYTGPMLTISGGGRSTQMTSGHRLPVKWKPAREDACFVYLMRKEQQWRVGWCQALAKDGMHHLGMRSRAEDADEAWVLSVHADRDEASAAESIAAARYQLPAATFKASKGNGSMAQDRRDATGTGFDAAEQLRRSHQALRDHGRDPSFAFWTKANDKRQDRHKLNCAAVNLLPELMQVMVVDSDRMTAHTPRSWVDFTVQRRDEQTPVYSLDVVPHHTYIADGIVSLNSIYSWRGARVEFIRQFAQKWGAKTVKLEENYRSSPQIVASANRLEAHSTTVLPKTLRATRADGNGVTLRSFADSDHESSRIAAQVKKLIDGGASASEIAIVYRANRVARDFEGALGRLGVRYQVWGGPSVLERAVVRDVHCHLQLLFNGALKGAWERAGGWREGVGPGAIAALLTHAGQNGQHPAQLAASETALPRVSAKAREELRALADLLKKARKRVQAEGIAGALEEIIDGIGIESRLRAEPEMVADEAREALRAYQSLALPLAGVTGEPALLAFLERVSLLEGGGQNNDSNCVSLMTMHATKGLEFDHVLLVGLEEGLFFPGGFEKDPEEERRLLYVGMTRARVNLHMSFAARRRTWANDAKQKRTMYFQGTEPLRFLRELGDTVRFVREDAPPRAPAQRRYAGTGQTTRPRGTRSPSPAAAARPVSASPGPSTGRQASASARSQAQRPVSTRQSPISYHKGQSVIHDQWGTGVVEVARTDRVRVRFSSGDRTILTDASALRPS